MTPLRQRMIEDMQLRNLSTQTQRAYLHYITGLARFYQTSPEHLSLEAVHWRLAAETEIRYNHAQMRAEPSEDQCKRQRKPSVPSMNLVMK
jgi:hypothetical protein